LLRSGHRGSPLLALHGAALLAFVVGVVVALGAPPALAAPKDKKANELYGAAMDEDYLNTNFDAAIDKLKKGIQSCGQKDCSPKVLGKLWVALGIVYGGGKSDMAQAKDSFTQAFKADKDAQPLEDFMTEDLKKVFAEAKKAAAGGEAPPPPKEGDEGEETPKAGKTASELPYEAPKEALVNTPLPIFIEVGEDLGAASAKLRYKVFGGLKWQSVNMKKMGKGFGGMIPCADITTTGKLRFYIILKDKDGDPVATSGSLQSPHEAMVKNKLDGEQPSFPGEEPPKRCLDKADCPPGFPGCEPKPAGGRGTKGWGASCDKTEECREGLVCLNGSCEQGGDDEKPDGDGAPSTPGEMKKNLITLGGQVDLLLIAGAADVCGNVSDGTYFGRFESFDNYFCYTGDGEFLGKPVKGKENEVLGGIGFAGARILLGYDRLLWRGLAVGARFGVAFGGSPDIGDAEDREKSCRSAAGNPPFETVEADKHCRPAQAKDFLPIHAELRASYFFLQEGLVRPYAFLVPIGVGQINAGVTTNVCDTSNDSGLPLQNQPGSSKCPAGSKLVSEVEAFQITGLNFSGFGGGVMFALHEYVGVNVEAKGLIMWPTVGFAITPTVAPVLMF
jgi:hypothetical protein